MIRKALWLSATSIFLTLFTPAGHAEDRVVNVFNWSDYIDPAIIKDFTKETGINVVYDTYDSNEILETKLLAGGSGYDVVVPTASPFMVRQIEVGVYQKLDKSKLPNLSNMWNMVMDRVAKFDPGNEYSVNYMWGTTGIGYNKAKVKEALGVDNIDSWDAVLKPENIAKLANCGVYFLDSPTDIFPTVLNYIGLKPDSTDPEDIKKAADLMMSIRPSIRKFHSSEYIEALANGDICVAVGYSGDLFQARDRAAEANKGVEIAYSLPKEGAEMWFDEMAIPADAPHVAEAHEFINYMMRPDVIAKSTNIVVYANGNKSSQQFVKKEILSDPKVYPPEEMLAKLFTVGPYNSETQHLVTRLWTKVITGQ